jgi:hypothetical protein
MAEAVKTQEPPAMGSISTDVPLFGAARDPDSRLTKVEAAVNIIYTDILELKSDIKGNSNTIKELKGDVKAIGDKIEGAEQSLNTQIDSKVDGVEKSLTNKVDGVEKSLSIKIDGVDSGVKSIKSDIRLMGLTLSVSVLMLVFSQAIIYFSKH